MVQPTYSFLDVTILDEVREGFAAGDALVVLSSDLDEVVWANGTGARLLGYPDIGAALGEPSNLGAVARRQLMATRGFPEIGRDRATMVRLPAGPASQPVRVLASAVKMPDGEPAILMAVPFGHAASRAPRESARRAIEGFSGDGQFAAILDGDGHIEAASAGFDELGLAPATLASAVAAAGAQEARLAKRMLNGVAAFPAGIARLTDNPVRNLLVVIDERDHSKRIVPDGAGKAGEPVLAEAPPAPEETTAFPLATGATSESVSAVATTAAAAAQEAPAHDVGRPDAMDGGEPQADASARDVADPEAVAPDSASVDGRIRDKDAPEQRVEEAAPAAPPADVPPSEQPVAQPPETVSSANEISTPEVRVEAAPQPAAAERPQAQSGVHRGANPLRFVWRTDATGRLSQISPEFGDALGLSAVELVGRPFRDVAADFGLDSEGEIAGLLERRDTWSGRSVLWPVPGENVRVPVDLAALPVYDRNRVFEGFRGFGIARLGEAMPGADAPDVETPRLPGQEPAAIEPAVIGGKPEDAEPTTPKEEAPRPEPTAQGPEPTDPFQGEVPALEITPRPERRQSDKVIRLAEHRQAGLEKGLSPGERSAFREIGERLKTVTGQPAQDPADVALSSPQPSDLTEPGAAARPVDSLQEQADLADSTLPRAGPSAPAAALGGNAAAPSEPVSSEATDSTIQPDVAAATRPAVPAADGASSDAGRREEESEHEPAPRRARKLSLLDYTPDRIDETQDSEGDRPIIGAGSEATAASAKDGGAAADATAPAVDGDQSRAAHDIGEIVSTEDMPNGVSTSAERTASPDSEPGVALETLQGAEADFGPDAAGGDTTREVTLPEASGVPVSPVEAPTGGETAVAADPEEALGAGTGIARTAAGAASGGEQAEADSSTHPHSAGSSSKGRIGVEAPSAGEALGDTELAERLDEAADMKDAASPLAAVDGDQPSAADKAYVPESDLEPRADEEPEPRHPTDTSILERLPVPILIHAGDRLFYANPEFLALSGHADLGELEGAGGLDALFVEPYAEEETRGSGDHVLRLRDKAGVDHPIEAVLRSVPWNGGNALMLVVRRTNEQLSAAAEALAAEREAQLKGRISEMRTIIDTATDGVVLVGVDGTIRSISRPAEAMFGFDAEDVVGKPFASLFAPESQRLANDYLNGLLDNGVASVLNDGREVIGREAQGRFIPMFMTMGRLPGETGFCAVLRDITQWKRAEEELTQARAQAEQASSLKTEFLARVSHEIRTPLNAIIGFSELMVDEKFGPVGNDRYRDYLRDINRSGSLVLDLVNDLLDISKIEAGQQEMSYEAVSLNDTLAETVALMQPQANRERVIIRSSFASRLPDVVADLRSIRQIALNILSNAVRYTPAGGQVIVSTAYEASGDVVFRVRDTGVGMSAAEIEQALKPFKQINALKRSRGDGTGLGLPLTKAMVEANRARFTISSTPGEGTLVEIAFPTTRVLAG